MNSVDRGLLLCIAAVALWIVWLFAVGAQWYRCPGAMVQGLSVTGYVCVERAR